MTEEEINSQKPTFMQFPFADNSDSRSVISATGTDVVNYKQGFPIIYSTPRETSGKSVARKDMNAILHDLSTLNYYFQYMGRNPYISSLSYPIGAKVWIEDAEYVNTVDGNVKSPITEDSDWIKLNNLSGNLLSGGITAETWTFTFDDETEEDRDVLILSTGV